MEKDFTARLLFLLCCTLSDGVVLGSVDGNLEKLEFLVRSVLETGNNFQNFTSLIDICWK